MKTRKRSKYKSEEDIGKIEPSINFKNEKAEIKKSYANKNIYSRLSSTEKKIKLELEKHQIKFLKNLNNSRKKAKNIPEHLNNEESEELDRLLDQMDSIKTCSDEIQNLIEIAESKSRDEGSTFFHSEIKKKTNQSWSESVTDVALNFYLASKVCLEEYRDNQPDTPLYSCSNCDYETYKKTNVSSNTSLCRSCMQKKKKKVLHSNW